MKNKSKRLKKNYGNPVKLSKKNYTRIVLYKKHIKHFNINK